MGASRVSKFLCGNRDTCKWTLATDAPSKTIARQFQHRQLYLACTANHLPVEWLAWYVTPASVLGLQANG